MTENEEMIKAQNQVIGILFEVIKRLQANSDLDEEYFEIIASDDIPVKGRKRLDDILVERKENAEIVGRLLKQFEND
ncbi:MAG: hydrolase [Thaumarchaeota archaeon]|nr:hydrolase [Nitrososphaerota archaeon]